MKKYSEDTQRVANDALGFSRTEYGKYRMEILDGMIEGALSAAINPTQQFPDRYLARYAALKELKDSILGDLESNIPSYQK